MFTAYISDNFNFLSHLLRNINKNKNSTPPHPLQIDKEDKIVNNINIQGGSLLDYRMPC